VKSHIKPEIKALLAIFCFYPVVPVWWTIPTTTTYSPKLISKLLKNL